MHVLIVVDHPNPASFSHALAQAFSSGAQAAGHDVEIADLNQEGFDPRWSMADITADGGSTYPPDVLAEQARIGRADAVCLVFPLFWWGMPAMMKGWVDRVWAYGWAYDQLDDRERSLQRPRTGVLLVAAGSRSDAMESEGYKAALETIWTQGTFGYFGFTRRLIEMLNGTQGSPKRREALLARAYRAGFELMPAERVDHLAQAVDEIPNQLR